MPCEPRYGFMLRIPKGRPELTHVELQSVADYLKTNKKITSTKSKDFKDIIDIVLKQTIASKNDQLTKAGTYMVDTNTTVFRQPNCYVAVKDLPPAPAPKANCRLFLSYRVDADKHLAWLKRSTTSSGQSRLMCGGTGEQPALRLVTLGLAACVRARRHVCRLRSCLVLMTPKAALLK
jgi:hypothetical protein